MSTFFQKLDREYRAVEEAWAAVAAERSRLEFEASASATQALGLLAGAGPALKTLSQRLAELGEMAKNAGATGVERTARDGQGLLRTIAQAMADAARELRPAVRHDPKPPGQAVENGHA